MKTTKQKKVLNEAAQALGKLGGNKIKRKYGKKHFAEMGRKGMAKRWKKLSTGESFAT